MNGLPVAPVAILVSQVNAMKYDLLHDYIPLPGQCHFRLRGKRKRDLWRPERLWI